MAFTINYSLQVEDPTGSNNWLSHPAGITRLTGESANYRIYYSFSATEGGTFDDMSFEVTFPDAYSNLSNVSDVGLPLGASYTMDRDADRLWMKLVFAPSLPSGQSGFIEFFVNSLAPAGPNDYLISPTIRLTGQFHSSDGAVTPINESGLAPTWTVRCALHETLTKQVTYNGSFYVEDADAYIVDYRISRRLTPPVPGSYKGVWAVESCTLTEYLPVIPGVTPTIVWADRPYTRIGGRVIWDFSPAQTPLAGVQVNFRLLYPKAQVDARGGPSAIGNITDYTTANYMLRGGVSDSLSSNVTHRLLPVPAPVTGTATAIKASNPPSISGTILDLQNIPVLFTLQGSAQNGNMIPSTIQLTDLGLKIELADGTVYEPAPDEIEWNAIQINNDSVSLEYKTALGGDTWTDDPTVVGRVRHPFPTVAAGDHITSFRFSGSGFTHPFSYLFAYVWLTVKRRSTALAHYKSITNEMSATITMSDGTDITENSQVVLPVDYTLNIVTQIVNATVDNLTVNPGGTVTMRAALDIAAGTTTPVNGTDMLVVIPPGFSLNVVKDNETPLPPSAYTVTPNWQATGQSLLRVPIKYSIGSQAGQHFFYSLECGVSPLIIPALYDFQFWYVLNSDQANDPNITHSATGTTAPDIYDFDGDGDLEELVAMRTLPVTISSAHVVNVLKLSKGPRDADFDPDNDTHITRGEQFLYRKSVRNDSSDPITDLVMIDIFPYLGDEFGSQWRPLLNTPILPPPGVVVQYSLSDDPVMAPIGPGGTGAWLDVPPADMTTVRSVRFDFGSRIFLPGESASVIADMVAPIDAPINTTCFNSVRYIASAIIGGRHEPYLPAYSPPAYARVTISEITNIIGDYVWSDINGNGIQDPGEPGINGITVELYDDSEALLQTTVSGNSPDDGSPGYYSFRNLAAGIYRVKFDPAPLQGAVLTVQHAGSDPNLDSDPDPITGYTDFITLDATTVRTDIDAGYFTKGPCHDELCQAITDLIESVALEQAALSHILNAEGEKLQAYLAMPDQTPGSLLKINSSVKKTVDAITQLEMILQGKINLIQP